MTKADIERAWHELGIRCVIDLRGPERGGSGPIAGGGRGVIVDFFGLMGGFETVDTSADGFLPSLLDRGGRPLAAFYRHLVASDRPVLVHCHTGKDRTGFIVAMTLAMLGAADESIVADYARSGPVFDQMLANLDAKGLGVPAHAPPYASERPSAVGVGALLHRLRDEWGTPEAWAASQGVEAELLNGVRARLLGPR